ncbi:MAG: SDR family NAD(P)-dependent oxidoreductase [bacterium]
MASKSERLLEGKNVVVTGCLKGIGRATLDMLAENGANVWACSQYEDADFTAHVKSLEAQHNVMITPVYFDLQNQDLIKAAVKTIFSAKKPVDALVNIAGMTQDALFQMVSMAQLKQIFDVNFFSQILFTQYIVKLMLRNKKGSVVNVVSISGIDGNPGQLSYSASKGALIAATKTLSAELAPQGIRVNAIAPGVIKTEMTEKLPDETLRRFMAKSAVKHMGLPGEVAGAIMFLVSDLSSYVTGQIIRVDGGIG